MSDTDTATAPTAEAKNSRVFSAEQIKEIRDLRAMKDAETGKPVWSHAKLADKFDTKAGTISQIVRNRTYKDADYEPTNDGK